MDIAKTFYSFSALGTIMKQTKSIFLLFFLSFLLFHLFSCASSGAPLTEIRDSNTKNADLNSSYYEEDSKSTEVSRPITGNISRNGYQFKLPNEDWEILSDLSDENVPLELYHSRSGLRGVVQSLHLESGEALQIMDRAQIEMQSFETLGKKAGYSNVEATQKLGMMGAFWEIEGIRSNLPYQACGFVTGAGQKIYMLTISLADSALPLNELKKEWESLYQSFKIDDSFVQEKSPEISPEIIKNHESKSLGYTWSTKDTLWHYWLSIANQNSDPSLVLTNLNEDITLFVYGATVSPEEVSSQDLFKVLLLRLGVDPNNPTISTYRERGGSATSFIQNFELTHYIGKYDFKYKGRFFWDNGRGILISSWTQGVLFSKYQKIMDQSINGLVLTKDYTKSVTQKDEKFNASVLSQVGVLRLAENQPLVALSYFERANKLDPEEPLYLINCGFIYQLKELYGPGISYFTSQMNLVQKNGKLLSILGEMYEVLFDYANARKYAELALQYTPNNPEYVINLSDALWGLGQRTQSLFVVQRLYDKQPSSRLGVYLAKTYMGLDQYAEAVEILYNTKNRFGINHDLSLTLMDALLFLKRYDEALAISEEIIHKGNADTRIWTQRGKTQFYLKNYKLAEKSLTKALQLKNDNEEAKSFLSATKAFLGKADNRTLQKVIKPIEASPSNLKGLINKEVASKAKKAEYPAVIHYNRELLKVEKGKPWLRTEELFMEILDRRGTAIYQEFAFDFLPGYDRLYLNTLEVFDSTMTLKYTATLQNAYITYATEIGGDNESQTAHFPLPALEPGDYIYLQVSRTSLENKGFIPYTDYKSSKDIPIAQTSFKILADTSKFVTEEYGPLQRIDYPDAREWKIEEPIVIRKEMFMPVYRDFGAGILLTGKQEWKSVGEDYENMIRHQFKSAVSVREKAFEIKGSRIGKEALFAIIQFVRENIRYREVAFGGHSLIPQTAEITLKERRGDCKDQSLLLKEMLDVIGIPSHLAAIHLTEMGFENLPTIQQFNHMILYVPAGEKYPEMWIDPTDKFGNNRPIPLDMEGKVALIIDGENSRVTTTPILEDDQEHKVFIHHKLFIKPNGESEFRDSLTLEGKFASFLRNQFFGKDSKEQEQILETMLSQGIPDVSISQIKTENASIFNKPFILVTVFTSKGYFGKSDGGIKGRYPNIWERHFMRMPKVSKRHHPIRMPHETHFETTFDIQTNAGTLEKSTLGKLSREPDYISYEKEKNGIRWTTFALYADPNEYEKIREEWNFILSETSPLLIVK